MEYLNNLTTLNEEIINATKNFESVLSRHGIEIITENERILNAYRKAGFQSALQFLRHGVYNRLRIRQYGMRSEKLLYFAFKNWVKHTQTKAQKFDSKTDFNKQSNPKTEEKAKSEPISLNDLNLPVRAMNVLQCNDIFSISELLKTPPNQISKLRNAGRKTVIAINNAIEKAGLSWSFNQFNEGLSDERLLTSKKPEILVRNNPAVWEKWKIQLKERGLLDDKVYYAFLPHELKWPAPKISRSKSKTESVYASKSFRYFFDLSFSEIIKLKAFGKNKFRTLIKGTILHLTYDKKDELNKNGDLKSLLLKSGLTQKEHDILNLRIVLLEETHTLASIGKKFGVSRERIRQIQKKALSKLRNPNTQQSIKNFLDRSEPEIWNIFSLDKITIKPESISKNLPQLDGDLRLALFIYTGSQINSERLPNIIEKFLSNRFRSYRGIWYRGKFTIEDINETAIKIEDLLVKRNGLLSIYELSDLIKVKDIELINTSIIFLNDLETYKSFLIRRATNRKLRLINLIHLTNKICKECDYIDFNTVSKEYFYYFPEDSCSNRDLMICMSENKEYFFRVFYDHWLCLIKLNFIDLKRSDKYTFYSRINIHEEQDIQSKYETIIDTVKLLGISNVSEINNTLLKFGKNYPQGTIAAYLSQSEEIAKFAPGLYGLREWLDMPNVLKEYSYKLLNPSSLSDYLIAVESGLARDFYPLWVNMEHSWLEWAKREKHIELYDKLIAVSSPESWSQEKHIINNYKIKKDQAIKKMFLQEAFGLNKKEKVSVDDLKKPILEEVLSVLLVIQREKSINWVRINTIFGARLNFTNRYSLLLTLGLLGVVRIPNNVKESHSLIKPVNKIIHSIINFYTTQINKTGNSEIALKPIYDFINTNDEINFTGWLSNISKKEAFKLIGLH